MIVNKNEISNIIDTSELTGLDKIRFDKRTEAASSDFYYEYECEGIEELTVSVSSKCYYECEGIKVTTICFSESYGSQFTTNRHSKITWDDEMGYNWDEFVKHSWVVETTKDEPEAFEKNGKWYKRNYSITY